MNCLSKMVTHLTSSYLGWTSQFFQIDWFEFFIPSLLFDFGYTSATHEASFDLIFTDQMYLIVLKDDQKR